MKLSEPAEEILETLWGYDLEDRPALPELSLAEGEPAIEELHNAGYVRIKDARATLTDKGVREGEKIVRRHRLAERLFADVLDVDQSLIHPVSCKFEHLLHGGIEDNICILLGHPKTCPHGRPIPAGECCRKQKMVADKIVSALSEVKEKQKGKVAYLHTQDQGQLQKLMAMGVLPGMPITLIQRFPSFVFQIGQSQFAVDQELAASIFVRLMG